MTNHDTGNAPRDKTGILIDGLLVCKWESSIFEEMRKVKMTAANCTVSVWEGFADTIRNIMDMKKLIRENQELALEARTISDINEALESGKTGIILGFQNAHAIEDDIRNVEVFSELGVRVIQLTYNTQNLVGTGCYERDSGLSGYGHEVLGEMNRLGIVCDLSHCGSLTAKEAIEASQQPVCYSHTAPAGLKDHPRNKTDEQLRHIADHSGFVGVTMFASFLDRGAESTADDFARAIVYVTNIVGEESVGIGTDYTQGHDRNFFEWITHDKGRGRRLTKFGAIANPKGLEEIADLRNLEVALEKQGLPSRQIENLMGQNWMNYLGRVWKSSP